MYDNMEQSFAMYLFGLLKEFFIRFLLFFYKSDVYLKVLDG